MTAETICIFEDGGYLSLAPLAATRPVFDLRLGAGTLRERIEATLGPSPVALHCRSELAAVVEEDNPGIVVNSIESDRCLFVNGRVVADEALKDFLVGDKECLVRSGSDIVAARVSGSHLEAVRGLLNHPLEESAWEGLPVEEIEATVIHYPWELVSANPGRIARDFEHFASTLEQCGDIPATVHVVNSKGVQIGPGCKLGPGAVLDAGEGPILIGADAEIGANAVVRGPCVIGEASLIHPLTLISGSTVGPVCKLGGEIRECLIQGYSNKQHEGFLGHAYLGEWVNLGAGTDNSDLKNNYSTVRVKIGDKQIDSGEMSVGSFVGDHTKSAIGSRFNTGSVFGVSCLLYADGFLPKHVPSFTWLGHKGPVKYSLDKAIETARTVMLRRGVDLTPAKEAVLRGLYDETAHERK